MLDRHLSNEELWAACYASNVIATPYPNHRYSASIVIRAAAACIPVLANNIGWMGEVIPEHDLGTACNTNLPAEFEDALVRSLQRCDEYELNASAKQFVKFNSVENYTSLLTARLEQRMGLVGTNSLKEGICAA